MRTALAIVPGRFLFWAVLAMGLVAWSPASPGASPGDLSGATVDFPPSLDSYGDADLTSLAAILRHRIAVAPFNLVATILFILAVVHTFLTHKFLHWAHVLEDKHKTRWRAAVRAAEGQGTVPPSETVSVAARLLHFLGEVEAVFGIWVVPLIIWMALQLGTRPAVHYLEERVHFIEPIFVVVIMALASTRPVLRLAEACLHGVSRLGGATPVAWWFSILIVAPLLGSLITEPAAMTIAALLLGRQFYRFGPSPRLAYATLGLLFVNISVGGTLTHFAAPPVLMVAGRWNWDTPYMFTHFGLQTGVGILLSTGMVYLFLRRDFASLSKASQATQIADTEDDQRPVPRWVTVAHLLFMAWSVLNAHHPVLLVGGFLFFLAFYTATEDFQSRLELRSPILVGFFLAALVIHGGLQQWWIAPVLRGLGEWPLFVAATGLTAFNDNAAITYLASLVPGFPDAMKHAVVAGAVTGGGLTVIANAPNPAGQAILGKHFRDGIAPMGLFLGALAPTIVVGACMMFLKR